MCTNLEYIRKQIEANEIIYIDTCSLMDISRLMMFIEHAKPLFLEYKKKITIHYSVMEEIFKFEICSNEIKRNQAHSARMIILDNSDLFDIQSNENEWDNSQCFADKELLSTLFENRISHRQLLISNDHSLTTDAFNFNRFGSVRGNKINVCYLNSLGAMHMCDCVKQRTTTTNTSKENNTTEEKTASEEKIQENIMYNSLQIMPLLRLQKYQKIQAVQHLQNIFSQALHSLLEDLPENMLCLSSGNSLNQNGGSDYDGNHGK